MNLLRSPAGVALMVLLAAGSAVVDAAAAAGEEAQRSARRHRDLGDVYQSRDRLQEACEEWRLALELDPQCPGVPERLSGATPPTSTAPVFIPGTASEALPAGLSGLALELAQAEQHYRHSRLKEAAVGWQRALAMDPENAPARSGLERLALETYQAQPGRPFDQMTEELYQEGMKAYRRDDWPRAGIKLAQAANLNPQQPQVQAFLQAVRQASEQAERLQAAEQAKAAALAAEGVQRWPEARDRWLALARLMPEDPEAAAGVSRASQALEQWAQAELEASRRLADAGELEQALERLARVLKIFPDHPQAQADNRKARAALNASQKNAEHQAQAGRWFNQGAEAYRRRDWETAISAWEAACRARPEDQECRRWLEKARAERQHQRAEQRAQAEIRYADGLAAYQRGDLDGAIAAWKETLQLHPEHEKARANLQRIQSELK